MGGWGVEKQCPPRLALPEALLRYARAAIQPSSRGGKSGILAAAGASIRSRKVACSHPPAVSQIGQSPSERGGGEHFHLSLATNGAGSILTFFSFFPDLPC